MKLQTAALRRYRSIEDAGTFGVQDDVTCLVGKNESGKTAVLQGLYKSAPVDAAKFDEGLDYPSRLTRERKTGDQIRVSTLTYILDDEDVAAVEERFGVGVLTSREIDVSHGYRYNSTLWTVHTNEKAAVDHLLKALDLPAGVEKNASASVTVASLVSILSGLEAPTSAVAAALATVSSWRDNSLSLGIIDVLSRRRPKFVYFGDYDSMPGKLSIPYLMRQQAAGTLSRGEQAVLALLDMAGVKLEDFQDPESHEHLVRDLENASNSISNEVFEYWTQNKNLAVRLDIIARPEASALPSVNEGPLLQIRVVNQRHNVSVPFDERSRGFVWFFSFLAYFTHLEENESQPLILLLDEPGLNLHATAQADLLRFIDERLAPTHQVVFSTHSPFMVDAHRFERVRTVVDNEKRGTVVSSDVLEADAETAFPLHAALGVELSQTLFVGPHVLLVEGPGDVLYLEVLSAALKKANRTGLDERLVVTPAGGIAKIPVFVALLGANKLNTVVLVDSSGGDQTTFDKLRQAGRLNGGGLVQIADVLPGERGDIEDLFEPAFFLELINDAYAGLLKSKQLTEAELPTDARLIRRVERAFEALSLNEGRINHFAPASAFARGQANYVERIPDVTLERAEALFKLINSYIPA